MSFALKDNARKHLLGENQLSWWEKLDQGLTRASVKLVTSKVSLSTRVVIVWFLVDFLQLVSFCFPTHMNTAWVKAGFLEDLLEYFGPSPLLNHFNDGHIAAFLVFLSIFAAIFAFSVFVVWEFTSKHGLEQDWFFLFFSFAWQLLSTVFFIPFFAAFVGFGETALFSSQLDLVGKEILGIVALLMGLLLFVSCGWVLAINFECDALGDNPMRRMHTRLDLIHHIVRSVAVVVTCFASQALVLAAVLTAASVAMCFYFVMYPPYLEWKINRLRVASVALFAWFSVCFLVRQIDTSEANYGPTMLVLTGLPFITLLAVLAVDKRRFLVSVKSCKEVNTVMEAEMKVRFHLLDALAQKLVLSEESSADLTEEDFESAEEMWSLFTKRFDRQSFVFTLWGTFHFGWDGNAQLGMKQLLLAADRNPFFDERFFLRRCEHLNECNLTDGSDALLSFLKYREQLQRATKFDDFASQGLMRFWSVLMEPNPDLAKLHEIGAEANHAIEKATEAYEAALQISSQSSRDLLLFGSFLQEVKHDEEGAMQLRDRAAEIQTARQKRIRMRNQDTTIDVFDDRNCVVTIGGSVQNLGMIEWINVGGSAIFGYKQTEITGRNISTIVPAPFSQEHDQYIKRFLETGRGEVINKPRFMFGLHKNNFIIPCMMDVRQIASGNSTNAAFVGVLKKIETEEQFCIVDSSGMALHWTAGLVGLFGSLESKHHVPLASFLPCYSTDQAAMRSKQGFVHIKQSEDEDVELQIWIERFPGSDSDMEVDIVRIRSRKLSAEDIARLSQNENSHVDVSKCILGGAWSEQEQEQSGEDSKRDVDACMSEATSFASRAKSHKSGRTNRTNLSHRRKGTAKTGSTNGTTTTMDSLRHILLSDRAQKASGLGRLKLFFLATLLLVVAAMVSSFVVTDVQLTSYEHEIASVDLGTERLVVIWWIATQARNLNLMQMGLADMSDEHYVLEEMDHMATELGELEEELYFHGKLDSKHVHLYQNAELKMFEKHEEFVDEVPMNLHDAVSQYHAHCQLVHHTELSQQTEDNPNVFFLYNNTIGEFKPIDDAIGEDDVYNHSPFLVALNQSSSFSLDAAVKHAEAIETFEMVFMVVSLVLLLLVLLFVFRPVIDKVLGNKNDMLLLFLALPRETVKKLHESASNRVKKKEMNEMDEERLHTRDTELSSAALAQPAEEKKEESEETASKTRKGRKHARSNDASVAKAKREKYLLYCKISVIFLLCCPYFMAIYFWSYSVLEHSMDTAKEICWAGRRRRAQRESLFFTREAIALHHLNRLEEAQLARERALFTNDYMLMVHRNLLYGNDHMELVASIREDERQDDLLFSNGCMEFEGNTVEEGCETFADGMVYEGLSAGLKGYSQILQEVLNSNISAMTLQDPKVDLMKKMARHHLHNSLFTSELIYLDFVTSTLEHFLASRLLLLVLTISAVVILYYLFYSPLIRSLHEDNRKTRALLFVIPLNVMEEVEALRKFIKTYTAQF